MSPCPLPENVDTKSSHASHRTADFEHGSFLYKCKKCTNAWRIQQLSLGVGLCTGERSPFYLSMSETPFFPQTLRLRMKILVCFAHQCEVAPLYVTSQRAISQQRCSSHRLPVTIL